MKKRKILLPLLIFASLLGLTSCGLFNDSDMDPTNEYNPVPPEPTPDPGAVIAGGVEGKESDKVPNALVFKNIGYHVEGTIVNTYKTGGVNHKEYNINGGEDYSATDSSNNYDLYVPNGVSKSEKHVVVLFIHGGAWISGLKTDVNPYVQELARRGYITATLKYTLLRREMDNPQLSIFRNLDEIDACVTSIKSVLGELNFDTTKTNLVIGGASSGAHLTMLYAYSRGQRSALPIRFLVDAVGPVEIKPRAWQAFVNPTAAVLNAGLSYDAIEAQRADSNLTPLTIMGDGNTWNDYQTMRIANGMCGMPYSLEDVEASTDSGKTNIVHPNAASNSMLGTNGGEDQLSVPYWIEKAPAAHRYPIICAYGGKDSIVGIGQYARLEKALIDYSVTHEYFYFRNSNHMDINADSNPTVYNNFVNTITSWCDAI